MSFTPVTKYDLTNDELDFLRDLTKQGTKFLLVGMLAAIFQGADGITRDIDLWFQTTSDEGLDKAARNQGGLFVWRGNPPYLQGNSLARVDVVTTCHGLGSFEKEYARAHDLDLGEFSIKVLPLERIIVSKTAANREKDWRALPSLKAAFVSWKAMMR
jgi:predicted nucleotidyltransferase